MMENVLLIFRLIGFFPNATSLLGPTLIGLVTKDILERAKSDPLFVVLAPREGKFCKFLRNPKMEDDGDYKRLPTSIISITWIDRALRVVANNLKADDGYSFLFREATRCGIEEMEDDCKTQFENIRTLRGPIDLAISRGNWIDDIIDQAITTSVKIRTDILLGDRRVKRSIWLYKNVKVRIQRWSDRIGIPFGELLLATTVYALNTAEVLPEKTREKCAEVITRFDQYLVYRQTVLKSYLFSLQKESHKGVDQEK